MYKIMTKLHTMKENVFAFHMVTNDNEEVVEYSVKTKDEAAEKALELLGRVGYEDLRIVDDKSYYLDLVYGRKPIPEENLYKLTIESPYFFHAELAYKGDETPEPIEPEQPTDPEDFDAMAYLLDRNYKEDENVAGGSGVPEEKPENNILVVNDIRLNETVSVNISWDTPIQSYHFVINDVEYKTGLPKWITYEEYNKTSGRLTFNGITRDYYIEVIVDDDIFVEPEKKPEDGDNTETDLPSL